MVLKNKEKIKEKIKNKITLEKLKKYFEITGKALEIIKISVNKNKKEEAEKIIDMAQRYYNDASFFQKKGDYVTAFGALNYAHGWIDVGSKIGIFEVNDDKLFVLK